MLLYSEIEYDIINFKLKFKAQIWKIKTFYHKKFFKKYPKFFEIVIIFTY